MTTPFDDALEAQEVFGATAAYSRRHGEPGTASYLAAWVRFSKRIKTGEDLYRARRRAHARRVSQPPAARAPGRSA